MKHIVFFTGAGMSQESGISTFRDSNGLWENHDVMEVASPEGFRNNPKLVLEFYNQRRKQLFDVKPNRGHALIALLESQFKLLSSLKMLMIYTNELGRQMCCICMVNLER